MIRFRNVSKVYPRTGAALSGVTFRLKKAEFAFLTGPSGAGKSTLLRLIHFQTRPSEGQVQVSRYHSDRVKRRDIPGLRRRVGFVFQDFKLLDRLTAAENVGFALKVTGTPRREIDGKIQRLLSQVGLAAKARSVPSELSGGERQRVVIARALATDPLVLLADEPTGNLDPRAADSVFQLFRTLNQLGMAVLMATHDAELMRRNPQVRVLELEHGRLVFDSAAQRAESTGRATSAGAKLELPGLLSGPGLPDAPGLADAAGDREASATDPTPASSGPEPTPPPVAHPRTEESRPSSSAEAPSSGAPTEASTSASTEASTSQSEVS